ncbi:peptidase inhibitor family I36 protein [Allokutzneria albata]|uniref:Peptidase inhibitor family I36 n=1 Tax=Allokutzneria albata TaxID=211114 RepID=A0A1H0DET5_ALLAB|nr:hypothetical protein SAMN04489726_7760 [Allokutzneria albata]
MWSPQSHIALPARLGASSRVPPERGNSFHSTTNRGRRGGRGGSRPPGALSRKGIARGSALGLVGVAITDLVGVAPAPATEKTEPVCVLERICSWEHTEFDGDRWVNADATKGRHDIDDWDDETSAVYNHSRKFKVTLRAGGELHRPPLTRWQDRVSGTALFPETRCY